MKENIIRNKLLTYNADTEHIKQIWIELNVIENRYKEYYTDIGFADDEFIQKTNALSDKYDYIVNIENYPQDYFNVYTIIINKFYDSLNRKYFNDSSFLKFFYNKINSLMYQRYTQISKFDNINNFQGLIFYYNIDLLYVVTRDIIKNYLLELFNIENYIAYVPLSLNPLPLTTTLLGNYNLSSYTDIDTSTYFHEMEFTNKYKFDNFANKVQNIVFKYLNIGNVIAINKNLTNYLFYKSNLVTFQVSIPSGTERFLKILSYSMDENYLYLTFELADFFYQSDIITLYETIKTSVPVISVPPTTNSSFNFNIVFSIK